MGFGPVERGLAVKERIGMSRPVSDGFGSQGRDGLVTVGRGSARNGLAWQSWRVVSRRGVVCMGSIG